MVTHSVHFTLLCSFYRALQYNYKENSDKKNIKCQKISTHSLSETCYKDDKESSACFDIIIQTKNKRNL